MKTLLLLSALISISAASLSCKTTKETSTTTSASDSKEQKYRLIVSFISKGAGVAGEKRSAFITYVESYSKKPVYKMVLWGREGETDYCFTLKELTKKEQVDFINEVRKTVAGSDQVLISENAVCAHQGR